MIQEELDNTSSEQERIQTDLENAIERANAMALKLKLPMLNSIRSSTRRLTVCSSFMRTFC